MQIDKLTQTSISVLLYNPIIYNPVCGATSTLDYSRKSLFCACSQGCFLCTHAFTHACLSLQAFRVPPPPGELTFLQTETIMGNTFGQDGTGRGWRRGGGSFSWVIPSHFQRSRVSRSSSSPDRPGTAGSRVPTQAPFHPACNSFLPPRASHLKKESNGRRGGK